MRFFVAVFWEFVQNLPPTAGFVAAVWLWRQQSKKKALVCIVVGSTVGSLLIRFTESTINNIVEPMHVTVINLISFSLGMLLFTSYLGTESLSKWSNWKGDLVFGGGMGFLIGMSQALATGGVHIVAAIIHSLAMALPIPLVLISVRMLSKSASTFQSALMRSVPIATAMTIVIGLVDYTYLLFL